MSIKSFTHQVVYFCIGLLIIFFQILPLQTTPQNWSGPNVLLVFFAAIVTKRPDYTSSFLIALIFLIEDFFLMRPPGLMSALIVISFHFLKRKIQIIFLVQYAYFTPLPLFQQEPVLDKLFFLELFLQIQLTSIGVVH